MTQLGINAALANAKIEADTASAAQLRARAKLDNQVMAKTALETKGLSFNNIIASNQAMYSKAEFPHKVKEIKEMAELHAKTAQDYHALYKYYSDYYSHTPGDKKTAYKFARKYGWYYDPRHSQAVEREMGWKDHVRNTTLGTLNLGAKIGDTAIKSIIGGK